MSTKLTYSEAQAYLAEAARHGKLKSMNKDWVDRIADRPWFQSSKKLDDFLQGLFSGTHAGPWSTTQVIAKPAVDYLINQGELWVDPVFWEMERTRCHDNVACLYEDGMVDDVYTGLALTEDGMWRSHSWGMRLVPDENDEPVWELVETTEPRLMYFGVPDPEYDEDPSPDLLPYFS